MTRNVLLAGFDGTSRVPGTSGGARRLWTSLLARRQSPDWKARGVPAETKSSALWCAKLRRLAETTPVDLALGGEHLISFPLIEALVARHRDLRLVVLDAHHDAYDHPLLTHYSLFHYTQVEFALPTMMLGVRHEIEKATPGAMIVSPAEIHRTGIAAIVRAVQDFVAGAPFYFSIDLDVLSPDEFGAVGDPIADGLSIAETVEIARAALGCGPVAADLVEYNPMRDPEGACLARIAPLLEEFACWLD